MLAASCLSPALTLFCEEKEDDDDEGEERLDMRTSYRNSVSCSPAQTSLDASSARFNPVIAYGCVSAWCALPTRVSWILIFPLRHPTATTLCASHSSARTSLPASASSVLESQVPDAERVNSSREAWAPTARCSVSVAAMLEGCAVAVKDEGRADEVKMAEHAFGVKFW